MAANQLMPLRYGTRQRIQPVKSFAYDAGNPVSIELPRVGLACALLVHFNGTITTDASFTPNSRGPHNIVDRFTLATNQGTASLYDVSGYRTHLIGRTYADGLGQVASDARLSSMPTSGAGTGRAVKASWYIPIAMNNGIEFNQGLINLQAPEIQVLLNIRFAQGSALAAAGAVSAIAGNVRVEYMYYEIPDPSRFAMPPLTVVRWLEESQVIAAVGEQIYTLPRQGTLMNLLQEVEINGASSDAWDSIGIRFNKTDTPYTISPETQRMLEVSRYRRTSPTGVIYWDFTHAAGAVNTGDARDMIDSEELSTTEFIVNIPSGTSLGASNNRLVSVRRILQVLE